MKMDIEKAKEVLNRINDAKRFDGIYTSIGIIFEAIQTVLNELDKKDKIINEMAFGLADYVMYYEYDKCRNPEMIKAKAKEQIDYFTKKVEGK